MEAESAVATESAPFLSFDEWNAKNNPSDPLERYRGYSDYYRKELLRRGEYDEEEANAVDAGLYQRASEAGAPLQGEDDDTRFQSLFAPKLDADDDLHAVGRYALEQGNTALSDAASRHKALLNPKIREGFQSPEEYEQALATSRSELELAGGDNSTFEDAKRAAVARGDLPFALIGGRLEIADGVPTDDASLAAMLDANPKLDARLIGEVKRQTAPLPGYEASIRDMRKQADFANAVIEADKANPTLGILKGVQSAANSLDLTNTSLGPLDAADLGVSVDADKAVAPIVMSLKSLGFDREFSDDQLKNYALDMAKRQISPDIDEANPANSMQKLSTGEYVVPTNLLLNKPLLDKALESVPKEQRETILKNRDADIATQADQIKKVLIASDRDAFMDAFDKGKAEGLSDVAIIDKFMADPTNEHGFSDKAKGLALVPVKWAAQTFGAIPALLGNETARDAIAWFDKDAARRREYVNLFGGKVGALYDLSEQAIMLGMDLIPMARLAKLAQSGASLALKSTLGSGVKGAVKKAVVNTLSEESQSLAAKYLRGAAKNTLAREGVEAGTAGFNDVVSAVGRDFTRKLNLGAAAAAQYAVTFNRSAGASYASLYSALEQETNADGTQKYNKEQIREIALPHSLINAGLEAGVSASMTALGRAGAERLLTKEFTRKELNTVFSDVRRNLKAIPAAAREGINMESADKMLESVVRKGAKSYLDLAGAEGAEEAVTELMQYVNEQIALDKPINLGDAVRQGSYAAMLGAALGGGVNIAIDAFSSGKIPEATAAAVRRSALLETATKLEATSPRTAAVFRQAAENNGNFVQPETPAAEAEAEAEAPVVDALDAEHEAVTQELADLTEGRRKSEMSADELAQVSRLSRVKGEMDRVLGPKVAGPAGPQVTGPTGPEVQGPQVKSRAQTPAVSPEEITRIALLPEAERGVAAAKVAADLSDHFSRADLDEKRLAPNELSPEREVLNDIRSIYESTKAGRAEQVKAERIAALSDATLSENAKAGTFAEPEHKALAEILAANPNEGFDASTLGDYGVHSGYVRAVAEAAGPRESSNAVKPIKVPAAPEGTTQVSIANPERLADIAAYDPSLPEQIMASADPAASAEAVRLIIAARTRNTPEIQGVDLVSPSNVGTLVNAVMGEGMPVVRNHDEIAASIDSDPNVRAAFEQFAKDRGIQKAEGISSLSLAKMFSAAIKADPTIREEFDSRVAQANAFPPADNVLAATNRTDPTKSKKIESARLAELKKHDFGKGVPAFLNSVLKTGKEPYRTVAKALLRIPGFAESQQITLVRIPSSGWAGVFVPETGEVIVNLSQEAGRGSVDTAMHELIHAATKRVIANPNTDQARTIGRLQKIRESLVKRGVDNYATSNMDEFVTHFFTDSEFQKQVEAATKTGEKSLFRVIADAIRELINFGGKGETITSDVMTDMLSLLNSKVESPYGMSTMRLNELESDNKGVPTVLEQPVEEDVLPEEEVQPEPNPQVQLVESLAGKPVESNAELASPLRIDLDNPAVVQVNEEMLADHLNGVNEESQPIVVGNLIDRENAHMEAMDAIYSSMSYTPPISIGEDQASPMGDLMQLPANLKNGMREAAQLRGISDEPYRMVSSAALQGNTPDDTGDNAKTYLKGFLQSLWSRVSGKQNDPFAYADLNRTATALQEMGASNEEIGAVFQQVIDPEEGRSKFLKEVEKYVTGNWPDNPNQRADELAKFTKKWASGYGAEIRFTYGDIEGLDAVQLLGAERLSSRVVVDKDSPPVIQIGTDKIQALAQEQGIGEFDAKYIAAKEIQEEVIHYAHAIAIQRRGQYPGESLSEAYYRDTVNVLGEIFQSLYTGKSAPAKSLLDSFALYYGKPITSADEEAQVLGSIMQGDPAIQTQIISEFVRQVAQIRKSAETTEEAIRRQKEAEAHATQWMEDRLESLRIIAKSPSLMGSRFSNVIHDTEDVLSDLGVQFQPILDEQPSSFYDALKFADDRANFRPLTKRQQAKYDRMKESGDPKADEYLSAVKAGRMLPWYVKLFLRRDDLPADLSQSRLDKQQRLAVVDRQAKLLSLEKLKVMREESPPAEMLKDSLGTDEAFMTPEQDEKLRLDLAVKMDALGEAKRDAIKKRDKALEKQKATSSELRGLLRRQDREANLDAIAKANETLANLEAGIAPLEDQIESLNYKEQQALEEDKTARSKVRLENIAEARLRQSQALEFLSQNFPKTYAWSLKMRQTLNELQELVAESLEAEDPATASMIRDTLGVYLNRSYQHFRNKDWANALLTDPQYQDQLNAGRKWMAAKLASEMANENREKDEYRETAFADMMADAKAYYTATDEGRKEVDVAIQEMLKGMKSGPNIKGGSDIRTDAGPFMFKNFNLPEELQQILGKEEDAEKIAETTLQKLAGIYANKKMLAEMVKAGTRDGYMVSRSEAEADKGRYGDWKPLAAKDDTNPYYGALAGMYAPEDVVKAFKAAFNTTSQGDLNTAQTMMAKINKAMMGVSGFSMYVATVGSTNYFVRNLAGGMFTLANTGINPFSPKTLKAIKTAFDTAFTRSKDAKFGADEDLINELISLNVAKNSATIGYIREIIERYNNEPGGVFDWVERKLDERNEKLAGVYRRGQKVTHGFAEMLANLAETTEDFPKIVAYLYEKQTLIDSGMTDMQAVRQQAADKVLRSFPSRADAPQIVTAFTNHWLGAFFAPFLRFKVDMFRITANNIRLGVEELKSDNAVIRRRGQLRLAGTTTVLAGFSFALPAVLKALAGVDDKEEESLRSALPIYSRNSTLLIERPSDGKVRISDLTFTNPYSFVMDTFARSFPAMAKGDMDAVAGTIGRFFSEELLGENIVSGKMMDVARNVDEGTGKNIYLSTDSFADKTLKILDHVVAGSITPATYKKIKQAYEAKFSADPGMDSPAFILASLSFPFKPRTFALEDMQRRSAYNSKKALNDSRQLDDGIMTKRPTSPEERAKHYLKRNQAKEKVFSELKKNIDGFISLGLDPKKAMDAAVSMDFSKKSVRLAVNQGLYERQTYSKESWKKILENAGPEGYEAVRAAYETLPRYNQLPGVKILSKLPSGGTESSD